MIDFFIKNAWPIAIALIGVACTYTATTAVYGFRIDKLEDDLHVETARVDNLEIANNQAAISLAQIQKDIEYIRLQVDRLVD